MDGNLSLNNATKRTVTILSVVGMSYASILVEKGRIEGALTYRELYSHFRGKDLQDLKVLDISFLRMIT